MEEEKKTTNPNEKNEVKKTAAKKTDKKKNDKKSLSEKAADCKAEFKKIISDKKLWLVKLENFPDIHIHNMLILMHYFLNKFCYERGAFLCV